MFNDLTSSLNKIFDKLKGVGYLREEDVASALREIRLALLEADVALPVVKDFISLVKERAVGEQIVKSISPGQMVVKVVQDCLQEILTLESHELNIAVAPPAVIMMVGLQGSGKTTTTAKIANKLKKEGKKPYMASLDIYRPAAQEQLLALSRQIQVDCLPIEPNQTPIEITKRALKEAKFHDVLLLDTAGRLHIDQELMDELRQIKKLANPVEILLVADAMTGQDAVNIAKEFNDALGLTGIILSRVDSDARGGAALSMSYVTKCPIKFLGVGEKVSDLEEFYPDRVASRILGMGDISSLVEKAAAAVDKESSEKMMRQIEKGRFDLNMLAEQLKGMKKMGGIASIMGMIPGLGKLAKGVNSSAIDDGIIKRQLAIISSMTKEERRDPRILNASRKIRIANGSGTDVQDINKLMKQFLQMGKMVKKFGKVDKETLMNQFGAGNFLRGTDFS